jgi:WD40 repeat protein
MALKSIGSNLIGNVLNYMDKKELFEFSLVSKRTKKHFDFFLESYSGLKALNHKEINYYILNQGDFEQEDIDNYSEYINSNEDVKQILIRIIKASRYIVRLNHIAANAATLLNYAGFDFSEMDLSGVSIPFADFSGAKLMNTRLYNANLKGVNLSKAYIKGVDFKTAYVDIKHTYRAYKSVYPLQKPLEYENVDEIDLLTESNVTYAASTKSPCICASEDCSVVAYSFVNNIYLYLGTKKNVFSAHKGNVSALCISKCNRYLVSGDDYQVIKIWKLSESYSLYSVLIGHTNSITCLSLSSELLIASGSRDKNVKVWDTKRRKIICTGHTHTVNGVSWTNDAKSIVSVSKDKTCRIWNMEGFCTLIISNTSKFTAMHLTNNLILTGDATGCIKHWDLNGKLINYYNADFKKIINIYPTDSKKDFLVHGLKGIGVYNLSQVSFRETHGSLTAVCFDDTGDYAVLGYSEGYAIKLFLSTNLASRTAYTGCKIVYIGLAPSRTYLIASKHEIKFYDSNLIYIKSLKIPEKITECSLYKDLLLVSTQAADSSIIKILNTSNDQILFNFPHCFNFSSCYLVKTMIVLACDNSLQFYDFNNHSRGVFNVNKLRRIYIIPGYIIINKDFWSLVKYSLNRMSVEGILSVDQEVIDVKSTNLFGNLVVCYKFCIAVYNQDLLLINKFSVVDYGRIFLFWNCVYLWAGENLVKIGFCDHETNPDKDPEGCYEFFQDFKVCFISY